MWQLICFRIGQLFLSNRACPPLFCSANLMEFSVSQIQVIFHNGTIQHNTRRWLPWFMHDMTICTSWSYLLISMVRNVSSYRLFCNHKVQSHPRVPLADGWSSVAHHWMLIQVSPLPVKELGSQSGDAFHWHLPVYPSHEWSPDKNWLLTTSPGHFSSSEPNGHDDA